MTDKKILENCSFITQRLRVNSWEKITPDKNFAKKIIEILTPDVTKSLPDGWQNISTTEAAIQWVKERDQESHILTIQLLSTEEIIGFIFLYGFNSENNYHDLRFGYLLAKNAWGKGLGTEVLKGLIKFCKTSGKIKTISGGVETNNIGSIRVLEKTGFSVANHENPTGEVVFYEYRFEPE